jgi:5-methylcytosine-specific restriction endonuclease McrA
VTLMRLRCPVLVLNASYEPINICAAKRALSLLVKGAARVEESHDRLVHPDFRLPSVIRLGEYRKVPVRRHVLSHRNIFLRDGYACQYCGERFPATKLTLDHLIPRAQKGPSNWGNLVAACHDCNHRKGDRTPGEAGMPLLKSPRPMTLLSSWNQMRSVGQDDPQWGKYSFLC